MDVTEVEALVGHELVAAGVSAFRVSGGVSDSLVTMMVNRSDDGDAVNVSQAQALKQLVDVPVIVVGRIHSAELAEQIIAYLKDGSVLNAVNVPAVSGELLEKIGPLLTLSDRMGCLLAQLATGPVKEVVIEYAGDFQDLDLSPVTTAVLKGLLTPMIKDDVNFVNAEVLAKERGLKVTETTIPEAAEYINLITVKAYYDDGKSKVGGTIFGQKDPRVVNINNFR